MREEQGNENRVEVVSQFLLGMCSHGNLKKYRSVMEDVLAHGKWSNSVEAIHLNTYVNPPSKVGSISVLMLSPETGDLDCVVLSIGEFLSVTYVVTNRLSHLFPRDAGSITSLRSRIEKSLTR